MYNYNELPANILIPMLNLYKENRKLFPLTNLSEEEKINQVFTTPGIWEMLPEYVFEYFYPEIAIENHIEEIYKFF